MPAARLYNTHVEIIPVPTPLLHPGDDLASILTKTGLIESNDIIAVSSKAVATTEGRCIAYTGLRPTAEAKQWAARCGGSPQFRQAILDETKRLHGTILPGCPQAMLTELRPGGLNEGTILVANAGLDESNVEEGFCIGWPEDPVASVRQLHHALETSVANKPANQKTKKPPLAVLITDSTCRPRRHGVTAQALVVSGFDPLRSLVGTNDLFGKSLRMTQEAVADQLATAANMIMGNADEATPAVIIRDHGIPFTDFEGWVPGISTEQDLFQLH